MNKYSYYIILFFVALVSCTKPEVASEQQKSFIKFYGGVTKTEGNDVKQLSDDSYVALGTNYTDSSMYLLKTDKFGNEIWHKTIGGNGTIVRTTGYSFQILTDGGFILAGTTLATPSQVFLVKTNSSGDTIWTRLIGSAKNYRSYNVQATSDGGFVLAGSYDYNTNDKDAMLYFVDANGQNGYMSTEHNDGNDEAKYVLEINNNLYLFSGYSDNSINNISICTVSKNNNSFTPSKTKASGSFSIDYLKQLSTNTFLGVGHISTTASGVNIYVVKCRIDNTSANEGATIIWENSYGGNNDVVYGKCAESLSNNEYDIIGYSNNQYNLQSMYFLKTDSSGNASIPVLFGSGTTGQTGNFITKTRDGGFITIGTNSFSTTEVLSLIKLKSDGGL